MLQSMGLQRVGHSWVTELNGLILHLCEFYFLYFSSLEVFTCSSIILLRLVKIFMTIAMNPLSGKYTYLHFLRVFSPEVLSCSFIWNIFLSLHFAWLTVSFYIVDGTTASLSLEGVTSCRTWILLVNTVSTLLCLLCAYPSSLLYF